MNIYSDKLAHIQVVVNFRYSGAQMCTREDTLAHYLGAPFIDDVMRHNSGLSRLGTAKGPYLKFSLVDPAKVKA